jgi:hypothetical protein
VGTHVWRKRVQFEENKREEEHVGP